MLRVLTPVFVLLLAAVTLAVPVSHADEQEPIDPPDGPEDEYLVLTGTQPDRLCVYASEPTFGQVVKYSSVLDSEPNPSNPVTMSDCHAWCNEAQQSFLIGGHCPKSGMTNPDPEDVGSYTAGGCTTPAAFECYEGTVRFAYMYYPLASEEPSCSCSWSLTDSGPPAVGNCVFNYSYVCHFDSDSPAYAWGPEIPSCAQGP